jgi:hemolysin D
MTKPSLPVRRLLPALGEQLARLAHPAVAVPAGPAGLQPTLGDILDECPPRFLCSTHYILVALVLSLIVVSSLVKVDIIVAAGGRLTTDAPPIVVQPLELSIIREIRVKVGDIVHKGDALATLDPTFTRADQASLGTQEAALSARIRRLEAELSGMLFTAADTQPDDLLQLDLYRQRRGQYAAQLHTFDEDEQRDQEAIRTTAQNRQSAAQQLALSREVEDMRAKLWQSQVGSKLTYLDAEATRLRAERDYEDTANHLTELQHALRSTQAARQVFIDDWRRQLLEQLATARADMAKMSDSMTRARRMNDLVLMTAPEDGVVLDIAKRSVGSVLREAEPLITLVPTRSPLIAEIMIRSGDVGYTKVGDEVEIKVDAFPYQRHGMLTGWLRSIGEDSETAGGTAGAIPVAAQGAQSVFHRSLVVLTSTRLRKLPEGTRLIPGMTLTAEVKVGARSVISYLISPIQRGFSESLREP